MHDVRHGVVLAYASKALTAEARYQRMQGPGRHEGVVLWQNAALYAWCQAEHGHIGAGDVVDGHLDTHLLDRRFLASVYGDSGIVQGEWSELHDLLLACALDVLKPREACVGLLHHAGLTAEEIAERTGLLASGVHAVLQVVRQKWDNLRQGKSSSDGRLACARNTTRPSSASTQPRKARTQRIVAHTNRNAARSAILAVMLEHAPVSTNALAQQLGVQRKATGSVLRSMASRGLVVRVGTEVSAGSGQHVTTWDVTDKGRRFAEVDAPHAEHAGVA